MVQTTTVFANVSKGVHASAADLRAAFGDAAGDEAAMCVEILRHGELQVRCDTHGHTDADNILV